MQRIHEIGMRPGVVRADGDGVTIRGNRLIKPARIFQNVSKIEMRDVQCRFDGDCPMMCRNGLIESAHVPQRECPNQ